VECGFQRRLLAEIDRLERCLNHAVLREDSEPLLGKRHAKPRAEGRPPQLRDQLRVDQCVHAEADALEEALALHERKGMS